MKQFLKAILIVVLVSASIAGTTYFFFSRLTPEQDYFVKLNQFLVSDAHEEFNTKLGIISSFDSAESDRFENVITTNNTLDNALNSVVDYLIVAEEHNFKNKQINQQYIDLINTKAKTERIMDEYIAKEPGIPKGDSLSVPANDVYVAFANYFVKYCNFMLKFNEELKTFKLNKNADLKFCLIEIYCNTVSNTFAEIGWGSSGGQLNVIKSPNNLKFMHQCFEKTNWFVANLNPTNEFDFVNIQFVKAFNNCNKTQFVNGLYDFVQGNTTPADANLLQAVNCFKQVFNV